MAVDNIMFFDGVSVPGAVLRTGLLGGLLAHDTNPVRARSGVLTGMNAYGVGSGLTWTVIRGVAVIAGSVEPQGSWLVSITDSLVTHAARDATYSRIDRVGLSVNETTGTASLVVTGGTPAAAPVAPATPAGVYLPLYQVTVPPTGNLVAVAVFARTAATGGLISATSTTRPTGGALAAGQLLWETDTGSVQRWSGAAWGPTERALSLEPGVSHWTESGWGGLKLYAGIGQNTLMGRLKVSAPAAGKRLASIKEPAHFPPVATGGQDVEVNTAGYIVATNANAYPLINLTWPQRAL